jgi:hypothetical protein
MQNHDPCARKTVLRKIEGASESEPESNREHDPVEDIPSSDLQLNDTIVVRNPFQTQVSPGKNAARALASGRRTVRLLWIALTISAAAHLVIPAYIVSATTRSEKVALMDGTESLIISSLVPVEESNELLETLSLWAAKSFLDRGPQGFDAPETLHRLFLPDAAKKAEAEFNALADEFSKKSIHQKFEVGRIDLQRIDRGVVMSHVVGQVLAQAQIGDEQVSQPQPLTLNLKLVRNPYLGRNQRYPFAVAEFGFGQAEQLPAQKGKEK